MSNDNGLPNGWSMAKLCDVCHVEMGQSPPSASYNTHGDGVPFFQGKTEFTDVYPITKKWCMAPVKMAKKDNVLLSVRAPVGPTNLAPSVCCIGRGLAALSPNDGVEAKYILYIMRYRKDDLANYGTGTTFDAISSKILNNYEIPIAPTGEQRRIVAKVDELLSYLDVGVAALERVKANLKRYRAAVLKSAVDGKLTEKWRAKNPPSEPAEKLLERILVERRRKWEEEQLAKYAEKGQTPPKGWKDKYKEPAKPNTTGLSSLPEGWCWATVDQVAIVGTGSTPLRSNQEFWVSGTIPWVTSTAVNKPFVYDCNGMLVESALRQAHLVLYPKHTLILALYGEGKTRGKVSELLFESTINQALAAIETYGISHQCRSYLKLFLQSNYKEMRSEASGGVQPNLNLGIVKKITFPLPSIKEQNEILTIIGSIQSTVNAAENHISTCLGRSFRLRQAILKYAFDGKLVPQDPADEPATILLEEIKAGQKNVHLRQTDKRYAKRAVIS